ncbi:MAG: ABC transporter ATP-binding protein [Promethearchaeota archaeon]
MSIECKEISFKYAEKLILEDLSINFGKGHLYGIIGPNGSGKTTFLKLLSGILKSTYGKVVIDNFDIKKLSPREIAKKISVVNQSSPINFDFSVREIVLMGRYAHVGRFSRESSEDKRIINEIFDKFDLYKIEYRNFNELSGGEQQKVIIAKAIAQKSKIILLDEPTNHLDLNYKIEFMEMLKQYVNDGIIIIIVLHDLNLAAQFCDKIILLNNGKIQGFGSVEEIITRDNIKSIYQIDVIVKKDLFSNAIYISPLRTKLPFSSINMDKNKPIKIHIIGGGGSALEILPKLNNFEVSIGIVNVLDDDYVLAKELNYQILSEDPFSPISEKSSEKLKLLLKKTDFVILTNIPFGKGNLKNLEILMNSNNKIIILEENPIEERDYTEGIASKIYNTIKKKKNVKIVKNLRSIFELILKGNEMS